MRRKQKLGALDKQAILQRYHHHTIAFVVVVSSSFRSPLPLLFSLTSFSSSSSSLSSSSFPSSSLSPLSLDPFHARETLGNNFSQPRQGTWSFFAKTKAMTGVRRGQRRPTAVSGDHRRPGDEEKDERKAAGTGESRGRMPQGDSCRGLFQALPAIAM